MEKRLKQFFQNLVALYNRQENISHIYYDKQSDSTKFRMISAHNILSEEFEDELYYWLVDYLAECAEVNYYEMYKEIMNQFFGMCLNPSSEDHESYQESEKTLYEKVKRILLIELCSKGYEVIVGSELIDRLVRMYDASSKLTTLTEFLDTVNISELHNHHYYIVDFELFTQPIPLNQDVLIERLNQSFPITQSSLYLYFEHLIVTELGLESVEVKEDTKLKVNFYCNVDNYLERNSCEMKESALRKLLKDAVEPNRPFIEAVVEGLSEVYINHHALNTEKDILDFVNIAYELEEVDREAKTFDRRQILAKLLSEGRSRNGKMYCHKTYSIY